MDYSEGDIINLVKYNLGFGFRRFVMEIYGIRDRSSNELIRIELILLNFFNELKNEKDMDLFDMLEDTSVLEKISRSEWRLRGRKIIPGSWPKGYETKKIWYPDFIWNDITPLHQRHTSDEISIKENLVNTQRTYARPEFSRTNIIKIKDFRKLWNNRNWRYESNAALARDEKDWNEVQIAKWMRKMQYYEKKGVLDEWFRVTETVSKIESHRGKDFSQDKLIYDLRKLLSPYIQDPTNEEAPSEEDIYWIFNELLND